jgi:hypothetical protein
MSTTKTPAHVAAPSPQARKTVTPAAAPAKSAAKPAKALKSPRRKDATPAPARPAKPTKTVTPASTTAPAAKGSAASSPKGAEAVKSKPKLVRDSFTMPKTEYAVLDGLKQRAAALTRPTKKSELLRAGVKMLAALSDKALLATLASVPTLKTGRPTKG